MITRDRCHVVLGRSHNLYEHLIWSTFSPEKGGGEWETKSAYL